MLDVQTMLPLPLASIPDRIALVIRNMLLTFTASSQSHSISIVSRKGFTTMVPA
jgi:hypothetical protein